MPITLDYENNERHSGVSVEKYVKTVITGVCAGVDKANSALKKKGVSVAHPPEIHLKFGTGPRGRISFAVPVKSFTSEGESEL